jgi:hypothetical protein
MPLKGNQMSYTGEEMAANAERHYRQAVKWAATGMSPESAKAEALNGLLAMQLAHYAIGTKHDRAPWPSVEGDDE